MHTYVQSPRYTETSNMKLSASDMMVKIPVSDEGEKNKKKRVETKNGKYFMLNKSNILFGRPNFTYRFPVNISECSLQHMEDDLECAERKI